MIYPSAAHPIELRRYPKLATAIIGNIVLAESHWALLLREAALPPQVYFPRKSVAMTLLGRSSRHSHCPYKGETSYFRIRPLGKSHDDAAWSYEAPYPAMADIRDYIAFCPNRVTIELGEVESSAR
ncbi:DUF427 domain-containing protein [Sphingomonas sp. PR090111-T3T-6A]|uniref:DUF427 domain-containing protein n=1 Tax=Sphingomonas sp. PR090111-T3T-6A TaxID=685778 RepID=UPI00037024E0|nr:DUF427 domain-containing protein [Sphingomonas sp. PR090111-T3T-6A]